MEQLVKLPKKPENQEYARICCNADLQLKHCKSGDGMGQLALLQHVTRFSCLRLCLAAMCRLGAARVSHFATGWHFPTRNPAWLPPGKPFSTTRLGKSSSLKTSDGKPSWKGWCLVVTSG